MLGCVAYGCFFDCVASVVLFFFRDVGVVCFFFFQAEDGIRDHCVTGVQTCALPIWGIDVLLVLGRCNLEDRHALGIAGQRLERRCGNREIGRASCRERV